MTGGESASMKIVITDYQYDDINQEKTIIQSAGFELVPYQLKNSSELIPAVCDADALIVQYVLIDSEVIGSLENCKIIIKYGIGVNNIDVEAATKKGIFVCNVPDYGVDEVSNHAITMIFMLAKKITLAIEAFRNGEWGYSQIVPLFRMEASVLGLVGFGRIPQMVAHKLKNFGLNIIVFDPYAKPEVFEEANVTQVDLETLCKKSDFISIHCPQTKETTHLFDSKAFKMMKSTAFIINTARGPIIEQNALIEALNNKIIAGAALDVFEQEPLPMDSCLFKMKNVILTPHIAWYSEESIKTLQRKVAEEVVRVLQGHQPLNCVNIKDLRLRKY